jgi:peptide chain release factor 2
MDKLQERLNRLKVEFMKAFETDHRKFIQEDIKKLEEEMSSPDFWSNPEVAQAKSKLLADEKKGIEPWQNIEQDIKETQELIDLNDRSLVPEINDRISDHVKDFEELKKELRFQGPYDDHDVLLSIYAGAGGTDAQDWAQMLLRMYVRWAESQKLKVQTIDQTPGEEAGIKSVTIELSGGSFLYGKLAGEHGVHRLVRLSPFNANNLRQTSFAKVEILPVIDKPEEVELDEKDLKVDVFRAGGHGGQSVNTTDSAVRVTHIPTGISVAIQNERSQLQNKETAMTILRSKLAALQLEQHTKDLAEIKGPNQSAEWGNQIRSYVLHPYKQVKDLRSGYETSDAEKVLDGNLDPMIDAWLENDLSS